MTSEDLAQPEDICFDKFGDVGTLDKFGDVGTLIKGTVQFKSQEKYQ